MAPHLGQSAQPVDPLPMSRLPGRAESEQSKIPLMPYIDWGVFLPEILSVELATSFLYFVHLISVKRNDADAFETSVGISLCWACEVLCVGVSSTRGHVASAQAVPGKACLDVHFDWYKGQRYLGVHLNTL